jgi:integrase
MKSIKPSNNNETIQVRFTHEGKRYCFAPIPKAPFNDRTALAKVKQICAQIESDVVNRTFDTSLESYRVKPASSLLRKTESSNSLQVIWDLWVDSLDISSHTKADHYEMVRRMIAMANPKSYDTEWFISSTCAPSTFNKRLGYLKSCSRWAVEQGLIQSNPYEGIKPRQSTKAEIKPFTKSEIKRIITGFKKRFPHYASFVSFLSMTGVRTSEAIGLTWQHIDFERNEIVIKESLSIDRTSNGYKRIRKSTKTGSVRHLTMTTQLGELLFTLKPNKGNDTELVFKSSKGSHIDTGNFREDWKLVLQDADIPYRKPYTTRHTLISHAIEQGIPLTGVAYIAGHVDTQMVMKTYGHIINRPELPQIAV